MGFKSTNIDPDVWLRPAVKPDGEEYYEYILVYVDDILAISVKAIISKNENYQRNTQHATRITNKNIITVQILHI